MRVPAGFTALCQTVSAHVPAYGYTVYCKWSPARVTWPDATFK